MTVAGHLRELRRRIIWMALALVLASVICFLFIERFVAMILGLSTGFEFVYLAPSELVTSYMKLALALGAVLSSPFWLWQIWAFVQPGLTARESRCFLAAMLGGFFCFLLGAVFCWFVALPVTLQFFYNFNAARTITASISFQNYLSFVLGMLTAFGIVFEMPVLGYLLARLGLIRAVWLTRVRKYAVLIVFIVAAVITPPDVVSQIMTALPMLALYELTIALARLAERRKKKTDGS